MVPALLAFADVLRERTSALIELPDGERAHDRGGARRALVGVQLLPRRPRSRIVMNSDVHTTAADLVTLAAHEAYPGHHTEHAVKEQRLVRERGMWEEAIQLVPTPQSLVGEGIAESASRCSSTQSWRKSSRPRSQPRVSTPISGIGPCDQPRPAALPGNRPRHRPADPRARRLGGRGQRPFPRSGRLRRRSAPRARSGSPPTPPGVPTRSPTPPGARSAPATWETTPRASRRSSPSRFA